MMKKIRLGMIGGGLGSMIGSIHRYAARLDDCYYLAAGAFSTQLSKSQQLGKELSMDESRIYPDFISMITQELTLPKQERIEAVSIVTPNHMHFAMIQHALENGLHVIVDKPLTVTLDEAIKLQQLQRQTKKLCCVTYTYAGYPMIKEARYLLKTKQQLGKIRKILIDFPQGWLSAYQENKNKQAKWRQDPAYGIAGTLADIGTHAFQLAEYVSGLQVTHVNTQMKTFVNGRMLDDDVSILLKFNRDDAAGIITVSQIAAGEEANININVYAEYGSLSWQHDAANTLVIKWLDKPIEIRRSGTDNLYLSDIARYNCRTSAGHPEGFIEAFANHYRNFAYAIRMNDTAKAKTLMCNDYPKIDQGVRGLAFIETVIQSAKSPHQQWTRMLV